MEARRALVERSTDETEVVVELNLDDYNDPMIDTNISFFDHMLEQVGRHSGIALRAEASGDTDVDSHHLVEDTGLVMGEALKEALGDRRGIRRYASMHLVFDETMVRGAVDVSGRPFFDGNIGSQGSVEGFPLEVLPEFYRALASRAELTLHLDSLKTSNKHHLAEASFKCLARLLRDAVRIEDNRIPSTKETLVD